jgi:Splicing factor 3B subunit 10 (SF3b10)
MSENFNVHAQLEQVFAKYPGTVSAETVTPEDYEYSVRMDALQHDVSTPARLAYLSVIKNEPVNQVRLNLLREMDRLKAERRQSQNKSEDKDEMILD